MDKISGDFFDELLNVKNLYNTDVKKIIENKCVALLKKDFKDPDNRSIIYFSISGTEDYKGNVYKREKKRYIIDLILKGMKIINVMFDNAHITYCPLNDNSIRFHPLQQEQLSKEESTSDDIKPHFLKYDLEYFNIMYKFEDFALILRRYWGSNQYINNQDLLYNNFAYYKYLKVNKSNVFSKLPIKYEINHYNCCERKIIQNFVNDKDNFDGRIYVSRSPCWRCQCAIHEFKKIEIRYLVRGRKSTEPMWNSIKDRVKQIK